MTEAEFQQAKAIEQEYFNRRDRLDRFVAAALIGISGHCLLGLMPTKWQALGAECVAKAVLAELERREKGGGQ